MTWHRRQRFDVSTTWRLANRRGEFVAKVDLLSPGGTWWATVGDWAAEFATPDDAKAECERRYRRWHWFEKVVPHVD
jgi:hypothetical protein